ncbi:T7SS effector LXG polymorphic toxin [Bombilactobacillus thymidiniphilus]|uniref:LXG domain-containing protein n=1 Tax=Bombilactobacillus thymidiniphilus TaxID=2923363 RepID=A0ABY4PBQ6_9LACO|nr:T7SS effector LXG polymorphic toxin [Bombilactobacillus thymidiniphilus]UQS82989.1 LXG domain-containing protein [Bombilactobacillus thymidiniphilus]
MKINMAQLVANHDELKAQAKTLEASLKDVGGKMMAVPQTAGFQGTAQKSILDYTKRVHQKGTADLQKSTAELVTQYGKLLESFSQNVDNSPTAIINSDVLQDLQRDLQKVQRQLSEARQQMNRALADAADEGANVSKLDDDAERQLQEESQFITKLLNDLANFNNQKVSKKLEDVSERLVSVEADVKAGSDSKLDGKKRFEVEDAELKYADECKAYLKKQGINISDDLALDLAISYVNSKEDKKVIKNINDFAILALKSWGILKKAKNGKFIGRSTRGLVSESTIKNLLMKDGKFSKKAALKNSKNIIFYSLERKFNIKTYSHSQVHNDLSNNKQFRWAGKLAKAGKYAGYLGTAIDWNTDFQKLKGKGHGGSGGNTGKAAAIATEHTAVKTVASSAGADVGSEAGALVLGAVGTALGGPIGGGIGAAVGSVVGGYFGGKEGDSLGSAINKKTDKFFGV